MSQYIRIDTNVLTDSNDMSDFRLVYVITDGPHTTLINTACPGKTCVLSLPATLPPRGDPTDTVGEFAPNTFW
jgi:hypothetical protein